MFIRKKTISGQDYAYLVSNHWTKNGSRQKAKYLGKIIRFEKTEFPTFADWFASEQGDLKKFVWSSTRKEIILLLVRYELLSCGFRKEKRSSPHWKGEKSLLTDDVYFFDPSVKKGLLRKLTTGKEVIAEHHEGFLSQYSFQALVDVKPKGYDEREQGVSFAKSLLEAGLFADHALFVLLFERWMKK